MLRTLETLTSAGQPHSMRKIVNRRTLADLLIWLREESDRALPDVIVFCRRAADLLVLLTTLA